MVNQVNEQGGRLRRPSPPRALYDVNHLDALQIDELLHLVEVIHVDLVILPLRLLKDKWAAQTMEGFAHACGWASQEVASPHCFLLAWR